MAVHRNCERTTKKGDMRFCIHARTAVFVPKHHGREDYELS